MTNLTATGLTIENGSNDPFAIGRKLFDFKFLDVLLIPRIESKLRERPEFKDREDLVKMLAPSTAREIRGAFKTMSGANGASQAYDNVREMKFRFPNELDLVNKAMRLRNDGKSDAEILETLKAEETV